MRYEMVPSPRAALRDAILKECGLRQATEVASTMRIS
jgi:hypothetical protein